MPAFWSTKYAGVADHDWIQTMPGRAIVTVIRLYGLGIEFFGRARKPDDASRVKRIEECNML